jgi:hypothetical protein
MVTISFIRWHLLSTTTTGIEIGNGVGPEDHGLAINDELLCAFFSATSTIHGYRLVEL